jgi:hypothetical protein
MMSRTGIVLLLLLIPELSFGQYYWWNQKHNWDEKTHWSQYMILSPAYLGPNALPVPEIFSGRILRGMQMETALQQHMGVGDQTTNLLGRLFIPLYSSRAGLQLGIVPVEYFSNDTLTRDLRRSRNRDGKGFSLGDLYIGTHIQLVQDHRVWPDLLLTINLKTASGTNLASARHTDSPGYYFDLSAGKDYPTGRNFFRNIRPFVSAGFYVWQINRVYYQNDAYLYGAGVSAGITESLSMTAALAGYSGYIGNGDKPVVIRLRMEWKPSLTTLCYAGFQQGTRDFPYSSFQIGVRRNFKEKIED